MKKLLGVLVLLGMTLPALAWARPGFEDRAARGRLVEMAVVDRDTGLTLPVYSADGLRFIEGRVGRPYSIQLTNRSNERVLVVLAVDGLNAISGKTAAYNQTGYVINPRDSVRIDGWRQSMQSVARFVFTAPGNSYAARTDRPWQVGVIGAAVFREDRPEPVIYPSAPSMQKSAPSASRSAEASSDNARGVGTGYGQSEWSSATTAQFQRRSSVPDELVRLDYDDRRGLARRGIRIYEHDGYPRREPEPFPGGFAEPPPPRW